MSMFIARSDENKVIGLNEFIEYCDEALDPSDIECIKDCSASLAALGANRMMLIEQINTYLRSHSTINDSNTYSSQSLLLAVRPKYLIRANVWVAPKKYGADDNRWEETLFSYDYPHNHNFNLLTTGCHGSGYETDIFRLKNPQQLQGHLGERVDMDYAGTYTLEPGTVLFYEKSKDVHVQKPPETLSVSLNLMPTDTDLNTTAQYGFDVSTSKIAALVGSQVSQQIEFFKIAASVGDEETAEILSYIAVKHPNQNARAGAVNAICTAMPFDARYVLEKSVSDVSAIVRAQAIFHLEADLPLLSQP
jgi:hypothetical protein